MVVYYGYTGIYCVEICGFSDEAYSGAKPLK